MWCLSSILLLVFGIMITIGMHAGRQMHRHCSHLIVLFYAFGPRTRQLKMLMTSLMIRTSTRYMTSLWSVGVRVGLVMGSLYSVSVKQICNISKPFYFSFYIYFIIKYMIIYKRYFLLFHTYNLENLNNIRCRARRWPPSQDNKK